MMTRTRPDESAAWLASHQKDHDAWIEWQREDRWQPATADFQRPALRRHG